MSDKTTTRREFLGDAAKAGAALSMFHIVPRHVLGGPGYTAPSALLNIGVIGVGGMGGGNAEACATENLVANAIALMESIVKAKPSAAKGKYLKSVTLTSTMGPGVAIDTAHLDVVVKH